MASTSTITPACALASPALADGKASSRQQPHCVGLPTLPPTPNAAFLNRPEGSWKSSAYCRKIARNVVTMATGEPSADIATELPEVVKTIQDAWGRLEDKYAVTSLGFAAIIALWGSTGMISAIDKLPLVPGVLELVGIGYTGWFSYRNLVFKPDRILASATSAAAHFFKEALIAKIKGIYSDIIGSS